jgi:AraC-like DNA-binding protein
MDYPVTDCYINFFDTGPGFTASPARHTHDFHEIYLALADGGTQHTDKKIFKMRYGDVFFFAGGQEHIGNGCPAAGTVPAVVIYLGRGVFDFDRAPDRTGFGIIRHLEKSSLAGRPRLPLSREASERVRKLCAEGVGETARRAAGWRLALKALVSEMLLVFMRDMRLADCGAEGEGGADPRIIDAKIFLESNFTSDPPVCRLAGITGLSRSRFHALFRRDTGLSMKEYCARLKCSSAAALLSGTDAPLSDVAARSGFKSMGCFFSVFRRLSGMTPERFRASGPRPEGLFSSFSKND